MEEGRACAQHWLDEELALVKPQVIVALGSVALKHLMGPEGSILTPFRIILGIKTRKGFAGETCEAFSVLGGMLVWNQRPFDCELLWASGSYAAIDIRNCKLS